MNLDILDAVRDLIDAGDELNNTIYNFLNSPYAGAAPDRVYAAQDRLREAKLAAQKLLPNPT